MLHPTLRQKQLKRLKQHMLSTIFNKSGFDIVANIRHCLPTNVCNIMQLFATICNMFLSFPFAYQLVTGPKQPTVTYSDLQRHPLIIFESFVAFFAMAGTAGNTLSPAPEREIWKSFRYWRGPCLQQKSTKYNNVSSSFINLVHLDASCIIIIVVDS